MDRDGRVLLDLGNAQAILGLAIAPHNRWWSSQSSSQGREGKRSSKAPPLVERSFPTDWESRWWSSAWWWEKENAANLLQKKSTWTFDGWVTFHQRVHIPSRTESLPQLVNAIDTSLETPTCRWWDGANAPAHTTQDLARSADKKMCTGSTGPATKAACNIGGKRGLGPINADINHEWDGPLRRRLVPNSLSIEA